MNDNQITQQSEIYRTGGIYISQSEHETSYVSAIYFREQPKPGGVLYWLTVSNFLGHEKSQVIRPYTIEDAGFVFHSHSSSLQNYGVIYGDKIALCIDRKETKIYHYFPSTKPFNNGWFRKVGNPSSEDLDYNLVIRGDSLFVFESGLMKKYFVKYQLNFQQNSSGVCTFQFDLKDWKRKSKKDKTEPIASVTLYFFGFLVLWMEKYQGIDRVYGHWLVIDQTEQPLTEDPASSKRYSARS